MKIAGGLDLNEGKFVVNDSAAAITSISIAGNFEVGGGTTTGFTAHSDGVTPIQCKGLILDMKELTYRFLQNSDFKLALNIQPKNAHYKMDEYEGTVGLELHHAKMHGRLVDVA